MRIHIQPHPANSPAAHPLLRWSRNILFVVSLVALGIYGYAALDARTYQRYQTQQFERALKEAKLSDHANEAVSAAAIVSTPAQVIGPKPAALPVASLRDSPLGQIAIPRIGISVMIVEGTGNRALRHAVGHIEGTPLLGQLGNIGIAGHRDTFFRNLNKIEENDEITLTTLDASYRYLVDFSEVVGPAQIEVLEPSDNAILTLVTCYPMSYLGPAPKRLIVRAHLAPE